MEKQQLDKIIEKIKSWMEFANENNDPFIKFAVEYFALNALLRLNFSKNVIVKDRILIERLKGYLAHRDKQIIKPEHIEEFKKILIERELKNLTNNRRIKAEDLEDINNVVEAVYWIRNNLFHGHKGYNIERDKKLVDVGFKILRDINESLFNNIK